MADLIRGFRKHLTACGRARSTIKKQSRILERFFGKFPQQDRRFPREDDLLKYLGERGYKPATLGDRYTAIFNFYQWLYSTDRILKHPMRNMRYPRQPKLLPSRVMTPKETRRMLEAIEPDPDNYQGYRDRLLLELLYTCSLRRSEAVALNVADFDPTTRSLRIRAGKTRRGRIVPVGMYACRMLETYLNEVRWITDTKALLLNRWGKRLSRHHVTELVTRLRKRIGIRTKATSHSFRKSSATHMLKNGARLEAVQMLLGHTDITATERYTKIYPRDITKMHRSRHPREKHKNLRMPKLKVPVFCGGQKTKRLDPGKRLVRMMRYHHPREKDGDYPVFLAEIHLTEARRRTVRFS